MVDFQAAMKRMRDVGLGVDEAAVRAAFGMPADVKARDIYRGHELSPVLVFTINESGQRHERILAGFRDGKLHSFWGEVTTSPSRSPSPTAVRGDAVAALVGRVKDLVRTAWVPETEEGEGPVTASRFGGAPALTVGERHPECRRCGATMPLFAQIASDELPASVGEPFGVGTLQIFYCVASDDATMTSCEAEGGWEPFSSSVLARLVVPSGRDRGGCAADLPPRRVVRWREVDDLPDGDDAAAAGVNLSVAEGDELGRQGFPRTGDKLLGWPAWEQGPERPPCPACGRMMEERLQIASEDNVAHLFGDMGTGHVFQCAEHAERLTFTWACG